MATPDSFSFASAQAAGIGRRRVVTLLGGGALATTLLRAGRAQAQSDADAYAVMASDPRLTIWTRLIDAGGLQSYARAAAPYTIFAASDDAFGGHPDVVETLLGYQSSTSGRRGQSMFPDTSRIVRLVRSHVTAGRHALSEMRGRRLTVRTLAGTPLVIDGARAPVALSWHSLNTGQNFHARLLGQPLESSNATIFVLDAVDIG